MRTVLLESDDAVDFVAHKIMRADWNYDVSRGMKRTTWRAYAVKYAIRKYLRRQRESRNDGPEIIVRDDDFNLRVVRVKPTQLHSDHIDTLVSNEYHSVLRTEEEEDRASRILNHLHILSEMQRNCVSMVLVDRMTTMEIARRLHVSRQCVQQHIGRAVKLLGGLL